MRHTTVTKREVSTVLKLVGFQVLATIATATIFAIETGGAFSRDWYLTGGFILINGTAASRGARLLAPTRVPAHTRGACGYPRGWGGGGAGAGMIVDLGMITCIVQGWNLGVQIPRRHVAPNALTQFEADAAYAVKADNYVVDRLQERRPAPSRSPRRGAPPRPLSSPRLARKTHTNRLRRLTASAEVRTMFQPI